MIYDPNNLFARILRNEVTAKRIMEDEYGLAFHDISPKAPIHALAIPKGPYAGSADFFRYASPEEITGFARFLSSLIDRLGIRESGFRLVSNYGGDGGQEVGHYHVHVLAGKHLGPMQVS